MSDTRNTSNNTFYKTNESVIPTQIIKTAAAAQIATLRLFNLRFLKEVYPLPALSSSPNVKFLIARFKFFALKLPQDGLT